MAIYPVLFLQYLRFFVPGLGPWQAWLVAVALIWGATWLNLRGTRVVGMASGWFVALVLAPFGVLATVAVARWLGQPTTPFPATPFHATGTSFLGALGIGVSQSIWNYSGWDNASTIGGEIEQSSATYPRATGCYTRRPWRSSSRRCCSCGAPSPSCAARSACRRASPRWRCSPPCRSCSS